MKGFGTFDLAIESPSDPADVQREMPKVPASRRFAHTTSCSPMQRTEASRYAHGTREQALRHRPEEGQRRPVARPQPDGLNLHGVLSGLAARPAEGLEVASLCGFR